MRQVNKTLWSRETGIYLQNMFTPREATGRKGRNCIMLEVPQAVRTDVRRSDRMYDDRAIFHC